MADQCFNRKGNWNQVLVFLVTTLVFLVTTLIRKEPAG